MNSIQKELADIRKTVQQFQKQIRKIDRYIDRLPDPEEMIPDPLVLPFAAAEPLMPSIQVDASADDVNPAVPPEAVPEAAIEVLDSNTEPETEQPAAI